MPKASKNESSVHSIGQKSNCVFQVCLKEAMKPTDIFHQLQLCARRLLKQTANSKEIYGPDSNNLIKGLPSNLHLLHRKLLLAVHYPSETWTPILAQLV